MSYEDPNAPVSPQRRTPRQGASGAPLGSTISIVLAVVAAVAGFLILNNITGSGGSSTDSSIETPDDSVVDEIEGGLLGTTVPPPTTEAPIVTAGASVLVANTSGVPGSAGRMTDELAAADFEVVTPATNSTLPTAEATIIQFDPSIAASQAVAESVARLMGGLRVEPVSTPPAVEGESLNGAGVLVLLGSNESDKTLAQLSAPIATVDPSGDTPADTEPAAEPEAEPDA